MESTKPIVLIFCDWYRPGYKAGGPITSNVNLVENLGDDIDFKVICSDRDYQSQTAYVGIETNKWLPIGKAEVMFLPAQNQTKSQLKQLIGAVNPQTIYINGLFSKAFSLFPLLASKGLNKKIVVAPRGMLAPGALSIKPLKKSVFLKMAKVLSWYRDVVFHVTSIHEKAQVQSILSPKAKCVEIPNLPSTIQSQIGGEKKKANSIRIISVTRIAKEKNTLFALECLSHIPSHIAVSAKFVGEVYDESYFAECKNVVAKLPLHIKVEFVGVLHPDEIPPLFKDADLFFLPTLGENYGHAIIESMLSGTPVLVSDQTPWLNLERDGLGKEIPLDNQNAFVQYITAIAELDEAEYNETFDAVSENARKRVEVQNTIDDYIWLMSSADSIS